MGTDTDRLKAMYDAGFSAAKTWIDSRYRALQFCAVLTVGSLTLGFDKRLLLSPSDPFPGAFLCILNFFVAFIGLRTEISNRTYNVQYFNALNEIESKLNQSSDGSSLLLPEGGPFVRGRNTMRASWVNKIPNVDRLHMAFYTLLMAGWAALLGRLWR
jgi:hypothetical protein